MDVVLQQLLAKSLLHAAHDIVMTGLQQCLVA